MSISPRSEHTGSSFGTPTPNPDSNADEATFGPAVKLNAVNAARRAPRHRKEVGKPAPMPESLKNLPRPVRSSNTTTPATTTTTPVQPAPATAPEQVAPPQQTPARVVPAVSQQELVSEWMRVPPGHPRISDDFGGFNRYVGGQGTSLNQYGGLDIGNGGPDGSVHTGIMVHIHTGLVLRAG